MKNTFSNNQGFVLLFAVLISSVILAIGTGIFNISIKEITLSRSSRDSQFAFFAADAGAECAFFWDRKYFLVPPYESLTAFPRTNADPVNPVGVRCNNVDIVAQGTQLEPDPQGWQVTADAVSATTNFKLFFADGSCAKVQVSKTGSGASTVVRSTGQSICAENDPRVVQRTIEARY